MDARRGTTTQRGYGSKHKRMARIIKGRQRVCQRCGESGTPDNPLSADHINPQARGGSSEIDNYQVLCRRCNSSKGH